MFLEPLKWVYLPHHATGNGDPFWKDRNAIALCFPLFISLFLYSVYQEISMLLSFQQILKIESMLLRCEEPITKLLQDLIHWQKVFWFHYICEYIWDIYEYISQNNIEQIFSFNSKYIEIEITTVPHKNKIRFPSLCFQRSC